MPEDLARFRLPLAVNQRLQELLDRQDRGDRLTAAECKEAEGLVNLAELLSLLQLRAAPGRRFGEQKRASQARNVCPDDIRTPARRGARTPAL
ncbi:MAG: hypothetical protein ABSA52_07060 [Candidatus Binatia bacterium]|jgi:hypothetical protein